MVKILSNTKYRCDKCLEVYTAQEEASNCEKSHDIIYLPIDRQDLKRLIMFISTGEKNLLTPKLLDLLYTYNSIKPE